MQTNQKVLTKWCQPRHETAPRLRWNLVMQAPRFQQ